MGTPEESSGAPSRPGLPSSAAWWLLAALGLIIAFHLWRRLPSPLPETRAMIAAWVCGPPVLISLGLSYVGCRLWRMLTGRWRLLPLAVWLHALLVLVFLAHLLVLDYV